MKKNSFRDSVKNLSTSDIPRETLEAFARQAEPYRHMDQAQLMARLQTLSRDPQVQRILSQNSPQEIAGRLSPYLNAEQRQKLQSLLAQFQGR